jgi:hypothetical protein
VNKHVSSRLFTATLLLAGVALRPMISFADDYWNHRNNADNWHRPPWERTPVPKLFDARGNVVGPVALGSTSSDDGGVVLDIDGILVYVNFERITLDGGFTRSATQMQWSGSEPSFGSLDCSGTAYISYINSTLRPVSIRRQGKQVTLYIAAAGREEKQILRSEIDSGSCLGYENNPYLLPSDVWRVERTFDLTNRYPEPLRVGY